MPETKRPMWESLDKAANARLAAGDMEGYEAAASKSVALKSMHFNTRLNQAAVTGDPSAVAGVMNEMVPGYKFDARAAADGSITGSVTAPDGSIVPIQYADKAEMAGMVSNFISNGNVAATMRENSKSAVDAHLKAAQAGQAAAQSGFIKANTASEAALLPGKVELQEGQAGLASAQTVNALANASKTSADKQSPVEQQVLGLERLGVDRQVALDHVLGKGDKAKSREQALIEVANKLIESSLKIPGAVDSLPMSEALKRASQLVDGAATIGGTARVGSGVNVGRGMALPGAVAAAGAAPATTRGMGTRSPVAAAPLQLDASESRRAGEIKAAVRAGTMSREDAKSELQALGFR